MPLSREQFNARMGEVLGMATPETHARMSEILTELTGEFDHALTESENAATKVQNLTKDNETLRKVNTDLFLKVGTPTKGSPDNVEPPKEEPDPSETLTYDKLFNEKGELL